MTLLSVRDLTTTFAGPSGPLTAVDRVSFDLARGETLGLVGESGCGKSTLGKTILRLVEPSGGSVHFDGQDITRLSARALKPVRARLQMVFQDPFASLNPRHTVGTILATPLKVHGIAGDPRAAVRAMLDAVGLPPEAAARYPHEFSGGQRQRIGIARALILRPDLVICDEPVSALDLSIQAQILNLLVAMKSALDLSFLFISHDLSVVRYFTDRVLVMYLGQIVEVAATGDLWRAPAHPYTRVLMAAVPDPARRRQAAPIVGELPSPTDLPLGCRFHTRCPHATDLCRRVVPPLRALNAGQVACHHAEAIAAFPVV